VQSLNGCTDTSGCVTINGIGLPENGDDLAISVYPNPANDVVTIGFTREVQDANMRMLDVTGNVVRETVIVSGKNVATDVSDLPAGVYVIEVREGSAVWHARFTKN
jgi:hypothetical protein